MPWVPCRSKPLVRCEKRYYASGGRCILPAMINEPISIVMPCFNEEACVLDVLRQVSDKFRDMGVPYELIVVDDGSTDRTGELLAETDLTDKIIRHRFNRGYGASLKDGIRAAKNDLILIMDGDGQHLPESIATLLEEEDGYDMVVGARRQQGSHYWRKPGKFLLKLLCQLLAGTQIPDINSGLRLLRKSEAVKYLHLCSDQFSFSTSITLAFLSDRLAVKFVPIDVGPRKGGKSQVKIKTGFSTVMLILRIIGTFNPLPIFLPPAIVVFMVGWGYMCWGLILKKNISDVSVLLIISSILLFCFALLADQLALLRREINKSRS